jgi:DNA invertase Pin-like site-specific DNA recombinase
VPLQRKFDHLLVQSTRGAPVRRRKGPEASAGGRAFGYVRVSTGRQVLSPELQAERIRAMVALKGDDLVEIITDTAESAKTGSLAKRPGAVRLLEMVNRGLVDTIIIAKLDRLTRSVRDLADLLLLLDRSGVALLSVAESLDTRSAAGRLVLNIMTSVAQWEREVIGERTASVLQMKKAHHQVYNHPAFGWNRDGDSLVENSDEQLVIADVRRRRAAGGTCGRSRRRSMRHTPLPKLPAGAGTPHPSPTSWRRPEVSRSRRATGSLRPAGAGGAPSHSLQAR